jgi:DNA-binding transcriptional MerR regulator
VFTLGGMNGLRVAELAARAGVAAAAVRVYERAGLLSRARRAVNGYRIFDESALEELAFIQRAKAIGMSLEDIAGLVAVWPGGSCQSLQAQTRRAPGRADQRRQPVKISHHLTTANRPGSAVAPHQHRR